MYSIPVSRLADLTEAIAKINKHADKLSQAPVTMTVKNASRWETGAGQYGGTFRYEVTDVDIVGHAPTIEGWEFIATIRHDRLGNHFYEQVAYSVDLDDYLYADRVCQHCNRKRIRNATYLLRNVNDDTLMQVGSSCLKDFTGGHDPHHAARACENIYKLFQDVERWANDIPQTTRAFSTHEFLAFVAQSIRTNGWISRQTSIEYGGRPTSAQAKINILNYYDNGNVVPPLSEDFELAQNVIEWARSDAHEDMEESEFKYQFLAGFAPEYVTQYDMGIVASAFQVRKRAEKEKSKRLAQQGQKYIGQSGDKITVDVHLTRIGDYNGDYGHCFIYNFVTDDGDHLVWYTSKDLKMPEGTYIQLSGTVKDHKVDNYTGDKQTIVTRCKVV